MDVLFIPLALAAGALLAVQAGANAQLSKAIGSPFAATTLQLSVGALLLLLLTSSPARSWHCHCCRTRSGGTSSEERPRRST
jgi:uncharacterized membrane protein YdcZ (DUF606 family)